MRTIQALVLTSLLISLSLLSGCATDRISLGDEGLVSIEKQGRKEVAILWTDVYEDNGDTVVSGVLRRRSHTGYPIIAHVDVTLFDPDGTILREGRTPDLYVARHIHGKGMNWTPFRVRLPGMPAAGVKVNMVVHSEEHEDKQT